MERSEQDWWVSFKNGSEADFALLYHAFSPILLRYGIKIYRDRELVEDSVQQLFFTLWRSRNTVSTPASVKNYLLKSLRSEMLKRIKHQQAFEVLPDEYNFETEASFESELVQAQTQEMTKQKINKLLSKLPPRQREVIFLKYYANLKYDEIATVMGLEQGSAYKLAYKAIHKLQKLVLRTYTSLAS